MKPVIVVILFVIIAATSCSENRSEIVDYAVVDVIVANQTIHAYVADTYPKKLKGLMGVARLGADEGMIFIYQEDSNRSFWMKNMLISIDIIYVNSDFEIVNIVQADPCISEACPVYDSEKPARYVLEVNREFSSKHGITEGMKVSLLE